MSKRLGTNGLGNNSSGCFGFMATKPDISSIALDILAFAAKSEQHLNAPSRLSASADGSFQHNVGAEVMIRPLQKEFYSMSSSGEQPQIFETLTFVSRRLGASSQAFQTALELNVRFSPTC